MESTRDRILHAIYKDMVVQGYQGTRPDKSIRKLGITKGALYHYFPDKKSIGYAIVDEIIHPLYTTRWAPLRQIEKNPMDFIQQAIKTMKDRITEDGLICGSPLNNLIQEMSPLDEGFRVRLANIVHHMRESLIIGFHQGMKHGYLSIDFETERNADFILSCIEGGFSLAKVQRNLEAFYNVMDTLKDYINQWSDFPVSEKHTIKNKKNDS